MENVPELRRKVEEEQRRASTASSVFSTTVGEWQRKLWFVGCGMHNFQFEAVITCKGLVY